MKIKSMIAMAAVSGLLITSGMVSEAMAQQYNTYCIGNGGPQPNGGCDVPLHCDGDYDPTGVGGGGACVPEMSDYLAMAFVVIAGSMMFYFRKRSIVTA